MSVTSPQTSKEWQADSDARALMDYHAIKKDRKRLAAARKVLIAKQKAQQQAIAATK